MSQFVCAIRFPAEAMTATYCEVRTVIGMMGMGMGRGLLTTKSEIKKGDFVCEYLGKVFMNGTKSRSNYMAKLTSYSKIVDGSTSKCLAKYVNHGCKPNSQLQVIAFAHTEQQNGGGANKKKKQCSPSYDGLELL